MLVEGIRTGDGHLPADERAFLDTLPDRAQRLVTGAGPDQLAARLRYMPGLVTTVRGYG